MNSGFSPLRLIKNILNKILCGVLAKDSNVPDKVLLNWFNRELNSSSQPKVIDGRAALFAPVCKELSDLTFISRYEPVFWSETGGYSKGWSEEKLRVDDDCSIIISPHNIALRSTASGASILYYHITNDYFVFATSIKQFTKARFTQLDPLGIGEILRFGAGYGKRTVLQGIERLPFGHQLDLNRAGTFKVSTFVNFARKPNLDWNESDAKEQIKKALERSLAEIPEKALLLFSGGVDSTLLAQILRGSGRQFKSTMLAFGDQDSELENARGISESMGMEFEPLQHNFELDDLTSSIEAYSSPTLDFSILPTYCLGKEVLARNQGPDIRLIDGTGGDAWFGFGSMKNSGVWRRLSHLSKFRKIAQTIFARWAHYDGVSLLWPIKAMGRASIRNNPGLGHLCTTPLYSSMIKLSDENWLEMEDEIISLYGNLTDGAEQDDVSQLQIIDACLIATSQFAAKTSQWDLSSECGTFYPFFTPEVVNIARTLPSDLFFSESHAKPLLKDLTIEMGLPSQFSYRKKSGFQPPLQKILSSPDTLEEVLSLIEEDNEVKSLLTNYAAELPRKLLLNKRPLTIQSLYAIWGIIVLTIWIKSLRTDSGVIVD